MEENWLPLNRTINFMRTASPETAAHSGYGYPQEVKNHARMDFQTFKARTR